MAFAKKKLRDRTKFHSKSDKLSRLYDALGQDVLPEEYGGTNGTMKAHIGKYKIVPNIHIF